MKKVFIFLLFITVTNIFSNPDNIEKQEKPKIGLVLAGGGAWGFAHVGVLRVLEQEKIPISYISGTSIGSIIGSLYSMGYTVDELEELIHRTNWFDVLNDEIDRRDISAYNKNSFQDYIFGFSLKENEISLPGGIIEGQKVDYLLSELHWDAKFINNFSKLPIPFRCVATDIRTGDPVVLKSGDITDAVRSSMSIPGVFTPVELNDDILVDGMFAMNLPVDPVIDMGADIVIAVNFDLPDSGLADYSTVTGALLQSFLLNMRKSIREQVPKADILISPDISNYSTFDYGMVEEIYSEGVKAAVKQISKLREYSDPELHEKYKSRKVKTAGNVVISYIEINGVDKDMEKIISKTMGLNSKQPVSLSNKDIENMIKDIYSLGYFDLITYKIDYGTLEIDIKKKKSNVFHVATEFDYLDNASLLLNLKTFDHEKINFLSELSIRLGNKKEIREKISLNLGFVNMIGLFSETNVTRDSYPNNTSGHLEESTEARTSLGLSFSLSRYMLGNLAMTYDFFNFDHEYHNSFILQSGVVIDTLNKSLYPDRGIFIDLNYDWTLPTDVGAEYSKFLFKSKFVLPVHEDKFSLLLGLNEGILTQDRLLSTILGFGNLGEVPQNQKIYIGGSSTDSRSISLLGYGRKDNYYSYATVFHSGFQVQPFEDVFVQIRYDLGFLSNDQSNLSDTLIYGYGLSVGTVTPIGPLETSLSFNNDFEYTFNISIGYDL